MTRRTYSQYCGLAQALDLVGERWALLVIRELLFGPKRYSDLQARLPGISTSVLASRLQELEAAGLVRARELVPPAASTVYELTSTGRRLEEAILALGRWGGATLGRPTPDRAFHPAWALLALRASFHPERAAGLGGAYELRIDGEVFTVRIERRRVEIVEGPATDARAALTTDVDTFLELGLGETSPAEAAAGGRASVEGDAGALGPLFDAFRFPAAEGLPDGPVSSGT